MVRTLLAIAALVLAICAAGPAMAAAAPAEPAVMFHGNVVFIDAVLLPQLGIPDGHAIDQQEMLVAVRRLTAFYQKTGYTLVDIRYKKRLGVWHVFIDEGRLERIIIFGAGSMQTVILRQALNLPYKVFNEKQLEGIVAKVKVKYSIPRIDWKVVPIDEVEHERFQLPDWMMGQEEVPLGFAFDLKPRYNLYVQVRSTEWGTGFGWGVDYNSLGLIGSADYSGGSWILNGDRERITVAAGGAHRTRIDDSTSDYYTFSHGELDFDYYLPPLGGAWFRPHLKSDGNVSKWQRQDVPLEAYWLFREEVSLNAGFELIPGLMVSAGAGSQFNNIFDVEQVPARPVTVAEGPSQRWFAALSGEMIFDEPLRRRDLEHRVDLACRYYFGGSAGDQWTLSGNYQKVFLFGFAELKLQTAGVGLWGATVFHDEYSIGWGPIHTSFGDKRYVHQAAWQSVDYGLSLYQEVISLHGFADGTVYETIDHTANTQHFGAAFAAGPGLSLLLYDSFFFRLYYAYGRTTENDSGWELSMSLRKVY